MSAFNAPRDLIFPPRPKRQKVGVACKKCRSRKVRCGGERPVCAGCVKRGFAAECIYDEAGRVPSGESPVLEDRQRPLHPVGAPVPLSGPGQPGQPHFNPLSALGDPRPPGLAGPGPLPSISQGGPSGPGQVPDPRGYSQPSGSSEHQARTGPPHARGGIDATESQLYSLISMLDEHSRPAEQRGTHDPENGSGEPDLISQNQNQSYAAGRSAPAPSRSSAAGPRNRFTLWISTQDRGMQVVSEVTTTLSPKPIPGLGTVVLLPRQVTDDYVECFWTHIHPLYPILHKPTFMRQYEKFWSPDQPGYPGPADTGMDQIIFYATMYLVFAMGCKFSKLHMVPAPKGHTAEDYYQRSRKIFVYDPLDSGSVQHVQLVLLEGVYTRDSNRCWNTVGLAIRVAQGLGMHLDRPSRDRENQIDIETRRRIWHTCIVWDMLLSMTFGRPKMISSSRRVPLPLLVDDEHLLHDREGFQPSGTPSYMFLTVYSSQLFEILDEVLSTFYPDGSRPSATTPEGVGLQAREMLSKIEPLNKRLEMFYDSLPAHVRTAIQSVEPRFGTVTAGSGQSQAKILHSRFLYTRLLLLRPLLLLFTKFQPRGRTAGSLPIETMHTPDEELIRHYCNFCLTTARDLSRSTYQSRRSASGTLTLHYVYLAFAVATVLLAAANSPMVDAVHKPGQPVDPFTGSAWETGWDTSLEILDEQRNIPSTILALGLVRTLRLRLTNTSDLHHMEEEERAMAAQTEYRLQRIGWNPFDPYSIAALSEFWFGQRTINLDWLRLV